MNLYDYYREEMLPQWDIFMDMRQRGIHVDRSRLEAMRSRLTEEVAVVEKSIEGAVGWIPNTRSWKDMGRLFTELGVKLTKADYTPTGRPKADEDKIILYASRFPRARDVLMNCLEIQSRRTRLSGFLGMALDKDDYYHPSYDPGKTKTGRCSSEGADEGGPQLQNIPSSLRAIFIPDDEECEFSQADQSQAEARVVAWDAQDPLLIEAFETKRDVHRIRGCMIYHNWSARSGIPPDDLLASVSVVCPRCASLGEHKCNHSERQVAKTCGHAFAYKMGIKKLIKLLRKIGVFIDEREGERIKGCVVSNHLVNWQNSFWRRLQKSPWLETPLGRKREFYGLLDEEMVREALSWFAQATVAQVTSKALIHIWTHRASLPPKARIITQTHDSVLINHRKQDRDQIYSLLQTAFNTPMTIRGNPLLIPIDIGSGPSWGEVH